MVRLPGGADAPGEFRSDHVSRAVLSAANAPCFSFPGGAVGQVVLERFSRLPDPVIATHTCVHSGRTIRHGHVRGTEGAGVNWEWETLEREPDLRVVGGAMVDAADERDEGRKTGS
jgi:hypothetical protein